LVVEAADPQEMWKSPHLIVFYLEGVGDRNMRTSSLFQFGVGAVIVILLFLPIRRSREPRFKPRPEPTEAEMAARRQKSWDAYLKERAGGDKTPPAEPQPRDCRSPNG
jgi:hypothetical protein